MKRNTGRLFVRVFVMSFFIAAFLFSAAILSYKAAVHFWKPKEEAVVAYQQTPISEDKEELIINEISKNLIFCYDEDTKAITRMTLEILNDKRKQLTYVTIPLNTQFTIPKSLYNRMIVDCPDYPQVTKFSTLSLYFDLEKALEYGLSLTENYLGFDIDYYTAVPKQVYDTIFSQKQVQPDKNYDSVPMEVFTIDFSQMIKTLDTRDKLKAYIKDQYPSIQSDIPIKDKLKYLDYYQAALQGKINFELLKGVNQNNAYVVDIEAAEKQIAELTAD